MTTTPLKLDPADALARHFVASALARAFADPALDPGNASSLVAPLHQLPAAWQLAIADVPHVPLAELGLGELPPSDADVSPLIAWLSRPQQERAIVHQAVFGLVTSKECPPYETEFCHWSDATYHAQQLADIAGFYAGFGVEVSRACAERQDHIAIELEFVSFLLLKLHRQLAERDPATDSPSAAITASALTAFVRDHIVWWVPTFARCVERRVDRLLETEQIPIVKDGALLLTRASHVLRAWVAAERLQLGIEPSRQIISPQVFPLPSEEECPTATPLG